MRSKKEASQWDDDIVSSTWQHVAVIIYNNGHGITTHAEDLQASEVPGFLYRLVSKEIRTNYFILENQYSTLADYSIRKRFGKALSDDVAVSAVSQINSAVLSSMIRKLVLAAQSTGNVDFDASPETGVSTAEHRRTFPDALEAAAQLIEAGTGRGALSFIVAGAYTRRILQTIGVDLVRKPLNNNSIVWN